jgi:hypothetical protein
MEDQKEKPTATTQQASTPPPVDTYVPSPQPGAPTPRYFSKRTALIVLAVIFIVAISYGISFALSAYPTFTAPHDSRVQVPTNKPTVTPNPTANWKTYSNEMWGLSFKYPAQYEISYGFASFFFTTTPEEKKTIADCIDKKTCENYYLWTTVTRITNQGSEDITTAIKKDPNNSNIDTYTKTTIDGHNAFEVVGNVPNQTGRKSLSIYIDFKTSVLHIETRAADAQAMDQYKKILATFQFPDQNTQVVTQTPAPSQNQVACTDEAQQCPDGSYVGRSGPKCEFVCPK